MLQKGTRKCLVINYATIRHLWYQMALMLIEASLTAN